MRGVNDSLLFPSFNVRASGGLYGFGGFEGELRRGVEPVNHMSGSTLEPVWTVARYRVLIFIRYEGGCRRRQQGIIQVGSLKTL